MKINVLLENGKLFFFISIIVSVLFCSVSSAIPKQNHIVDKQVFIKIDTTVSLVYKDTLILPSGKDFKLHVKMKPAAEVSAISFGLYFPEEFLAVDSMELKDGRSGYQMMVTDSLYRMVWSDINPINVDEGDTIITLYMRSLDISSLSNTIRLGLFELSEFADASASVIDNVVLEIPEIKYLSPGPDDSIAGYSVRVYPNPFDEFATIDLTLKTESKINISLSSNEGKLIYKRKEQSYPEGNHLFRISASDLAKGIYIIKITIVNPEISATKAIRILCLE